MIRLMLIVIIVPRRMLMLLSRRVVRPEHQLVLASLIRGRMRITARCIVRLIFLVHHVVALYCSGASDSSCATSRHSAIRLLKL